MNEFTNWPEVAIASLKKLGEESVSFLPNIVGAIFLLVVGWLAAKIISTLVEKALRVIKFDKISEKFHKVEMLQNAKLSIVPSKIIGKFVYWVIVLIFFITASETMGWNSVSKEIGELIRYLPRLFSGMVILIIGMYIASFIKQAITTALQSFGISGGKIIGGAIFYIILIILSITALNQAGIDTDIITSNVTIILGSVLFAFALAFGLASKEVLQNILAGAYSKRNFSVGQKVKVGDSEGEILKFDNVSVVIKTATGKTVIPLKLLLTHKTEILE